MVPDSWSVMTMGIIRRSIIRNTAHRLHGCGIHDHDTCSEAWADMIARGWKQIENRTWRTYYRGPFASQADKTLMRMKEENPKLWPKRYSVKRPQAGDLAF